MPTKYVVQTTVTDHVTVNDQTLVDPPSGGALTDGDYGDITVSGTGTAMAVDAGAITLAKQANLAANSIQGNNTGSAATPIALTIAQTKTLLQISNLNPVTKLGVNSGYYIDNAINAGSKTNILGAADRMELAPYIPSVSHSIDRAGIYITTGAVSATCKIVCYSSDANGYADVLLFETGTLSAATSNTFVEATVSQAFVAGEIYWLGVRYNSTPTIRGTGLASTILLGVSTSTSGGFTLLRRTLAYATAATSPFVFSAGERVDLVSPPNIRMRIV